MQTFHAKVGGHFSDTFKSITVDNGSEFERFAQVVQWGAAIYFVHLYFLWEQPVNKHHNGLLRGFILPKVSIKK